MAALSPPETKTGLQAQADSRKGLGPNENERKLFTLLQLGSHYWTPDFTPAQAELMLGDYIEDLADCRLQDLETACRAWRRNFENKRFPRSSELLRSIFGEPSARARLPTFCGHPQLEAPRATKTVGQILRENGHVNAAQKWALVQFDLGL